jgi:phenylacetate-CoA ligase
MVELMHKFLFLLGTYFRNKEIFQAYKFLKKTERWSIDELKGYQTKKAKELISWTYEHSAYYREQMDAAKVTPEDFNTLSDLKKFPIITKKELITRNGDIHIKGPFTKLFYTQTSGSTGQRLIFYRNKEWDARHRAAMFRGYSWYDVKPWDRNGYFWGHSLSTKQQKKNQLLDRLQNRFRVFSYKESDLNAFLKKLKTAEFLEGYSSAIYEVSKLINKHNRQNEFKKLKLIKGTAEKIFDKYQDEAIKAFGQKIRSEYGSAEAGIIAFECPHGNMHITMENVIVEEENGEILVTNITSKSFPLIRYKLGDYVELENKHDCPCGMQHPIVKEVVGRIGSPVYGIKETYSSRMLSYIFRNLSKEKNLSLNYQVVQPKEGQLLFKLEEKVTESQKSIINQEAYKYFNDDMYIEILDNQVIREENKKFKDFISKI